MNQPQQQAFSTPVADDKQILVVDDDGDIRAYLVTTLTELGYRVSEAANGIDALARFQECHPDLVLLDVVMPVMNGYTACRELRRLADDDALPIIMLTSRDDSPSVEHAFAAGSSDYMAKPINWSILNHRIKYALRNYEVYRRLHEQEAQLAYVAHLAKLGYLGLELATGKVNVSTEAAMILGHGDAAHLGSLEEVLSQVAPVDQARVLEVVHDAIRQRRGYRLQHAVTIAGRHEHVVAHHAEVIEKRPGVWCLAITVQDITEQVQQQELIRYKTFYDDLTDLPNRLYFHDHLMRNLLRGKEQESLQAVFLVGLDRFKKVNDSLGHLGGDQMLRSVAQRLHAQFDKSALVARYDGDVFAIHLNKIAAVDDVEAMAKSLLKVMAEPFDIYGTEIYMGVSIGISLYPFDGEDMEGLLKRADSAMHNASHQGGNQYSFHDASTDGLAMRHIILDRELRKAIREFQFQVFYQPQIDIQSMRVMGAEALLRWQHPERGDISPNDFIPVAEETGLINPLGMFVIETVCEMLSRWNEQGLSGLRIGINLSAAQFRDQDLVSFVNSLVHVMEIEPAQLELEITERIAVSNFAQSVEVLRQLRAIGVKTSMDDFGTGYSSLSYIQQLPIDTLKIDRAFVKDINEAHEHGEIAHAIVNMAQSLHLHTIAEGVETEAQFQLLKQQGVDEVQGWYFGKAMSAAEFERFVRDHRVDGALG